MAYQAAFPSAAAASAARKSTSSLCCCLLRRLLLPAILLLVAGSLSDAAMLSSKATNLKEYRKLKSKMGRPEYVPAGSGKVAGEPTCEELRAMWRFSKRQSRAAEMTNEVPHYRDPFLTNSWGPTGSSAAAAYAYARNTARQRPLYGRIVHAPPATGTSLNSAPGKSRAFDEIVRMFGGNRGEVRRRPSARKTLRFGGGYTTDSEDELSAFQPGTFQELRDLVQAERVRESPDRQQQQQQQQQAGSSDSIISTEGHHFGRMVHSPPTGRFGPFVPDVTPLETVRYGSSTGRYRDSPIAQMASGDRRTAVKPLESDDVAEPNVVIVDEPSGDMQEEGFFGPILPAESLTTRLTKSGKPYSTRDVGDLGSQAKCSEVEGRTCTAHADCGCQGDVLFRCSHNRCRYLPLSAAVSDRFGSWHTSPMERTELGLWQRRKRAIWEDE